jgi:hypothetical protein
VPGTEELNEHVAEAVPPDEIVMLAGQDPERPAGVLTERLTVPENP